MVFNCGVGEDSWESLGQQRFNLYILKEISPEYSLEGLMLKWKLQYFGHLMRKTDSFEKTLMLERLKEGGKGDDRGWGGWMASLTQWTWVWVNSRSWCWTGRPGMLQSVGSQRVGHNWVTEQYWTELGKKGDYILLCVELYLSQKIYFHPSSQDMLIWLKLDAVSLKM